MNPCCWMIFVCQSLVMFELSLVSVCCRHVVGDYSYRGGDLL
jgi:hypothetical protein